MWPNYVVWLKVSCVVSISISAEPASSEHLTGAGGATSEMTPRHALKNKVFFLRFLFISETF